MVVLNWKGGLGNVTLDPGTSILVPFQTTLASLLPVPIPAATVAQPDEYGIYFLVESIDPTTNAVTFKKDSDGFKIPLGYTSYRTTNNASTPPTIDDYLIAIGYPPGVLPGGTYSNALNLTTIRLGDGNDVFTLSGSGITQSLSAVVSKEASQGYIFQSNIFAGAGDDLVVALMPWQSVFKGGTNTAYSDAIHDPSGTGVAITLSDSLTLEEIPFGDTIELKGSRFDWDIEFRDGNGDGSVTLASILDESDYIATSNNNRIYGFERILFGDILFDLVLYRQLESSVVYGQPDYYLIGSEPQAPELNSDMASGSDLWEAFRFNRTKLEGITGTATNSTDVFTGNANDTPFLVGALQFASLNTEAGNDIVEIGSADQATVDLGSGSDQLKVNGGFSRSNAFGGDGEDNIILNTVSNSRVSGGSGRDIIEVRTSATDTAFDGGDGSGDTLLLPGTFASYALTSSNTGGVVTFTDGFGNSFTGFETFKFSDISLDALQELSITGPAAAVEEGSGATYTIALSGSGLASGESVAFSLQLGNGTAQFSSDLAALVLGSLQALPGIVLRNVSVDAATGLIQAVASANRAFGAAAPIATLTLPVAVDLLAEPDETFTVTLTDFVQSQTATTTISNVLPVTIRLNGPATVTEGSTADYSVVLDGVGLAAGRSVTFSLNSAGGTATEGADFAALLATSLQKADGIQLSGISTAADGTVTVTATNISGAALAVGATLLTLQLPITTDSVVEGNETFGVTLSSGTAVVSSGVVTTTISDLVPTPTIALSGQASVVEGQAAAYAVTLAGSGLLAGQSITFTLDSTSGTATEGVDFAALAAAGLTAGAGITLSSISTDPVTKALTLTAANTSGGSLAAGSQLLSFFVATTVDTIAEADEAFSVSLTSSNATVGAGSITTTITDNDSAVIMLTATAPPLITEGRSATYEVSLDGVALGVGGSVTFTLDSSSGTAIEGIDFAALTPAALTAGAGITLSGIGIDPITKAVTVTATNTSGADLAAGSQLLSFEITTIADSVVENSELFGLSLTSSLATVSGGAFLSSVIRDSPSSFQNPGAFTAFSSVGNVSLGSNLIGYALQVGSGSPIQITYNGINASPTSPGSGWTAIGAAANGAGFDLFFKNTNGSYALWNLNSSGAATAGKVLSSAEVLTAESKLGADLDGDREIGFSFNPSRTIGSVSFGTTQLGYGLRVNSGSPIQITYNGINASPTSPGSGWTAIGAAANGAGFDLFFKNTNGSYALWNLNNSGAATAGKVLSASELRESEVAIRADLSGDGRVGPFALRGGGPQADALTGLVNVATFGFAGDDTLSGGSPSANGFDILMGGSGHDSYRLAAGRSTLVIDNGVDSTDSITALGLSLNVGTTTLNTLEGGQHLVFSDRATNSRLYLYDWQNASNRIETFQFADGSFSFQQLQQKVTSLGASLTDATWANWDSQFGNGQLTQIGFASGAAMDNLISYYKAVDTSGVLA
ncbi:MULTISPECIES: Calx-beta domain-containing protein [unclassified Cyanobium]|uniref:beta strand repeat-containing protein n=1 Tax=unclassified Cyanobium TaxID=2627006 RepID=UPI0020CC9006|nr:MULTISPECIES: Calx-beta domain-containing protein [unclassified Cyanobium]MCP9833924.1 hypothetical protein [Cyanobium sp. La Preciosa 7G6]MCP9936687.1 hypothetical protein [Cyanobium sp. Aljojuca 7A6]